MTICLHLYCTCNPDPRPKATTHTLKPHPVSYIPGIIAKGDSLPCPIDDAGCFTTEVPDFAGRFVKDADKDIIARIKADGHLIDHASIVHSYPFCWRSDQPLLYKAVPSWFVAVENIKDRLLANNLKTQWVPSYVQEKRFHNWLGNAHDWAISRSRCVVCGCGVVWWGLNTCTCVYLRIIHG